MKHQFKTYGIVLLFVAIGLSTGAAGAVSDDDTGSEVAAIPEIPPPAVEEYNYPGAEQIFTERDIRLIEGDGGIVLTSCDTDADVIKVESVTVGTSCFEVIGERGWLTMEIPRVYLIEADEHNVAGQVEVNDETRAIDLAPGEHTTVGESDGDDPAALIALHAS